MNLDFGDQTPLQVSQARTLYTFFDQAELTTQRSISRREER